MVGDGLRQLDRVFHPRGVAVIGASSNPEKFGHYFFKCLVESGFSPVYPVNPAAAPVLGFPGFRSVGDIPEPVDLAVVVTPPPSVPGAVRECGRKGVQGVIIYTSGYREVGEDGRLREEELTRLARETGVRILGPNCVGIYCPKSKLINASYLSRESGPVGMVSHSGSMTTLLAMVAEPRGIRFSKVISSGNECDLDAVDFLEYLGQDEDTRFIVLYLEGVRRGPEFVRLAAEIGRRKPILFWKGGATEGGARAAASHTGSLSGSGEIWQSVIRQTGMTRVHSLEELVDCLQAFYYLEPPAGRNVVIVSAPGGPAVTTCDACLENGLALARLTTETREAIARVIPPTGSSSNNPIDIGQVAQFAPHMYTESLRLADRDPGVDMALTIGWPQPQVTEAIVRAKEVMTKPLALAVIGHLSPTDPITHKLHGAGIPVFPDPRRAARALGALAEWGERVRRRTPLLWDVRQVGPVGPV